jgi:hypothetical protein
MKENIREMIKSSTNFNHKKGVLKLFNTVS